MAELDPIRVLKWKAGRPADIWLSHRDLVAGMIKKFNLKALEIDAYPSMPAAAMPEAAVTATKSRSLAVEAKLRWPKPFPGGLRIPHLHYGADIYLLDRAQWKEFSGTVLREAAERIAKAKEISFEQTLELTEAVNTLG
ncbi:MAG: hypothetical protein CVV05_13395 [Gammaproteobacteria bacterium HGW-Gammaproteobacteria-1]|jgi:hypothetical protein|nr:MAG: hypothetical protein CVV05_13395 [Gammaproteobacteria bacterium HGW-Gammaproteobacteria-1]